MANAIHEAISSILDVVRPVAPEELRSTPVLIAAAVFVFLIVFNVFSLLWDFFRPKPKATKLHIGAITAEALRYYNGYDPSKPTLIAVKKKVYDVTKDKDLYGPGKKYSCYAGFPITRALALGSTARKDFNDDLTGLNEEQEQRLKNKILEFDVSYEVVGELVEPKTLSLQELAQYDGTDKDKPILLAIQGTVYDITAGKMYYGPDGVYPFAGKEVARAFALNSVELSDCTDNLEGLGAMEIDNLKNWIERFEFKYPKVGKIVQEGGDGKQ